MNTGASVFAPGPGPGGSGRESQHRAGCSGHGRLPAGRVPLELVAGDGWVPLVAVPSRRCGRCLS